MDPQHRTLLLRIAGGVGFRLEPGETEPLEALAKAGLVAQVDTVPQQADLQARYEALQETLQRFQEAKG